jgi:hypothetical protein
MRRRGERGETLAEVLVSTTLLGIIGIGIIGAIASVLISTDVDRKTSRSETVLRSFVAEVQNVPYEPSGDYGPSAGYDAPEHYTARITGVQCWHGIDTSTTTAATVPITFGACSGDSSSGLQKMDLSVVSAGSRQVTERVTIFKRDERP